MARQFFVLISDAVRARAASAMAAAPNGSRVEIKGPTRSLPQNDLMWARLTEIAEKIEWHGMKLSADDYKDILTAGLRKTRIVPNMDGDGFVALGMRTSDMTTPEMAVFLDLIDAFAAQNGVIFTDLPPKAEIRR